MITWLEKNNKLSWFITFLILSGIFYVSSLQFYGGTPTSNLKAIIYHLVAFFLLALFLLISLVQGKNKKFIFLAFLVSTFYSVADEIHQSLVPGRNPSFFDIFLDSIGILAALIIYSITLIYRKNSYTIQDKKV
jgi:VanZ family protein